MEFLNSIFSSVPDFITDALIDSAKLIPLLFIIFVFIELLENYFSKQFIAFVKYMKKFGPIVGTLVAIIPQCGFSVIATTLYIRRFISVGTLISVYIATSDEAIPILIADTQHSTLILKILAIKFIIAILAGYLIDALISKDFNTNPKYNKITITEEKGCCHHDIVKERLNTILIHPLKHTLNIFVFIFFVCVLLNFILMKFGIENVQNFMLPNSIWQPVLISIIGLIPNCSISVLIVMLYIEKTISFGSLVAGLTSGAGLGLLVLIKKNSSLKNTLSIISILTTVSICIGILFQYVKF